MHFVRFMVSKFMLLGQGGEVQRCFLGCLTCPCVQAA